MKQLLTSALLLILFSGMSQHSTHSLNWDGVNRQYIKYVPASYDGSEPVPVVFCLHGLGDNMTNFKSIGMNFVADTANFIVITPQALADPLLGSTAWNSGASYLGYTLNGNVDDIGFFGAILDSLIANYNINQKRVYSCGFSMGGFMTNKLGCEMNDRIAAIASVAGTIGGAVNCNPGRAVPACHFHGTKDSTVYYEGNLYGNDAEEVALFWAGNNNCNITPTVTTLPDLMADDFIITHKLYSACDDGAEVELFRVDSAEHEWLTPANDIFYTNEIWKFFLKHVHPINVSVNEIERGLLIEVFPNPVQNILNVSVEETSIKRLEIFNVLGDLVMKLEEVGDYVQLDLSKYQNGFYFLKVEGINGLSYSNKIVVQH